MRRELSHSWTVYYKLVLPAFLFLFLIVANIVTDGDIVRDARGNTAPEPMKVFVAIASILFALAIYWSLVRLKRVAIDDDAIYISNLWKEIRVPLTEITKVHEKPFDLLHPTTIKLRSNYGFGRRIVFLPQSTSALWGAAILAADIIRDAVEEAKRKTAESEPSAVTSSDDH